MSVPAPLVLKSVQSGGYMQIKLDHLAFMV
jgi:hypothetical protein